MGGDPLRREALLLQEFSQRSPRRSSAASALNQEVKHLAFVVDCPPPPVFPATDLMTISSRCQRALARRRLRRRLRAISRPNFRNQRRTVSFDTSMPRTASRSSTSRNDSVNRAQSQTACWMIAGGKRCRLKEIGVIRRRYRPLTAAATRLACQYRCRSPRAPDRPSPVHRSSPVRGSKIPASGPLARPAASLSAGFIRLRTGPLM